MRIDDFIHAGVAVFPNKKAGEIRDDRDKEHVKGARDNFENPIGDGESLIAVALRGVKGQGGDAICEREKKNDDENGAFDYPPEMDAD